MSGFEHHTADVGGTHASHVHPVVVAWRTPESLPGATAQDSGTLVPDTLPGAKRLMDEFAIASEIGKGTIVTMKKWVA